MITALLILAISASAVAATKTAKQMTGSVNINTATASELMMLPGIGKAKANAIIASRQATPFRSASDLAKIKGIGNKMLAKLQPYVVVDGATTAKIVKAQAPNTTAPVVAR